MKILHIDAKRIDDDFFELRYFLDNRFDYISQPRKLPEIKKQIRNAETDYYTSIPTDYVLTGKILYEWLNSDNHVLEKMINEHGHSGLLLAIAATDRLAHLPWELLHNGKLYLLDRKPAIIPVRWQKKHESDRLIIKNEPKNRAMNVLFMATAPIGIEPELDYEAEEAQILEATKRQPLLLTVEESGSLEELGHLVEEYDHDHFDALHITGHAVFRDDTPFFITETEFGKPEYNSADDIARVLQFQMPRVIFLSGCNTGHSFDQGVIPSMAEILLEKGGSVVLSWGKRVLDTDATIAAGELYRNLAIGKTVAEAVALTYQLLISANARDWHVLRIYVTGELPGSLVRRGRNPIVPPPISPKFVDPNGKLRIATRESFVGRRRELQNCLRVLKSSTDRVGVFIFGMGGLGKSTLASRLCERLNKFKILVIWRQIDVFGFVHLLSEHISDPDLRSNILDDSQDLKYRLRKLFIELNAVDHEPFLFVFDDFEWNLIHRNGVYVASKASTTLMNALSWAIRESNSIHRIIVTCRYNSSSIDARYFYKQPLGVFKSADIQKKVRRLRALNSKSVDSSFVERAIALSDGNPRLLEYFDEEFQATNDISGLIDQIEGNTNNWRDKIVWEDLHKQIDEPLKDTLAKCLIYHIPVPLTALVAVTEETPEQVSHIKRAVDFGLIDETVDNEDLQRLYRVSRIIPHLISNLPLSVEGYPQEITLKASEIIWNIWGNMHNKNSERWHELFRLLLSDKQGSGRFRDAFYRMLDVQPNAEADRAYESEIYKYRKELDGNISFDNLKGLLEKNNWGDADKETAWIFYQELISGEYQDWDDLLLRVPEQLIFELDQLWQAYSNGQFGFMTQRSIWRQVGGGPKANQAVWKKFCHRIRWYRREWAQFKDLWQSSTLTAGKLPALWATRNYTLRIDVGLQHSGWDTAHWEAFPRRDVFFFLSAGSGSNKQLLSELESGADTDPGLARVQRAARALPQGKPFVLVPSKSRNKEDATIQEINVWYTEIEAALANKNYDEVIRISSERLPKLHSAARMLALRAIAHHKLGQLEKALEDFEDALLISPNHAMVHAWCADILLDLGRYQESVDAALLAVELEPNNATFQILLGVATYKAGELEAAVTASRRALELDPGRSLPAFNLALVFLAQMQVEQARKFYQQALSVIDNPKMDKVNFNDINFVSRELEELDFSREEFKSIIVEFKQLLEMSRSKLSGKQPETKE